MNNTQVDKAEITDTLLFRQGKIILAHVVLFTAALFLSFVFMNKMRIDSSWFPSPFLPWLGVTLFVKLIVFGKLHQFQGWWRYASVSDLFSIMVGANISAVILVCIYFGTRTFLQFNGINSDLFSINESTLLLDWPGTVVLVCSVRMAIRIYYEEKQNGNDNEKSKLVLIIGAGDAGESLLREIERQSDRKYLVVGFIDDDARKKGVRLHGVPVLGTTASLKGIAKENDIDELIIAMPSATHKERRHVVEQCQGTNLKFNIVPDLMSLASGKLSVSQMREVDINDLLGRDPVKLDIDLIQNFISDKVVMITGAGGSIGSEMCRQVSQFKPRKILLVEQAENFLFFIDRELERAFPGMDVRPIICDITDVDRVDHLFELYKPEVVIHAAAHKHVPLMESNPGEAIKNNVVGTRTVAQASAKHGVTNFVMISTDKAVNPTSIMGSSKRIAEMSIQALDKISDTHFVTVRFGNVLGSNGSVIPIFTQQIAAGGPVTVTHPDMERYFMTIPEASQLVLQAATMGKGGEIFVLDMGEPVKIVDLARDLITLSGFRPGEDIEIKFSGIRPGEKLFEELSIAGENMQSTRHAKISVWENVPTNKALLDDAIRRLLEVADNTEDYNLIVKIIKEVVTEYVGDVDSQKLLSDLRHNSIKSTS
jgi:FlaA1/EpsC-like NDP-sugar epimerase